MYVGREGDVDAVDDVCHDLVVDLGHFFLSRLCLT